MAAKIARVSGLRVGVGGGGTSQVGGGVGLGRAVGPVGVRERSRSVGSEEGIVTGVSEKVTLCGVLGSS